MTIERFHQDFVNVGLDLRRLMRKEIVLTDGITLVACEIIRLVVVRLNLDFPGRDGCGSEQEHHPAERQESKACSHKVVFPHFP